MGVKDATTDDFNSHAHVERDHPYYTTYWISNNFNSHAHVERDFAVFGISVTGNISTHTLTWSVTLSSVKCTTLFENFNSHAHVERDSVSYLGNLATTHFNSHAHVERDEGTSPSVGVLETFQLTRSRGA